MDLLPEAGSTSRKRERLHRQVVERFTFSEEGKKDHDEIARRAWKHLHCYIKPSNWNHPTKIYEPKLFSDIVTHIAREMQAVFQAPPLFRYLPHPSDWQPNAYDRAREMENATSYYLDDMAANGLLWQRMFSALMQRRLFGTVYAHTYWRLEERRVTGWQRVPLTDPLSGMTFTNPDTGEPLTTLEYFDGNRLTYNGPWFKVLHWSEAFPDHMNETIRDEDLENDTWFIVRTMRPSRYLRARARSGDWNRRAVGRCIEGAATNMEGLGKTIEWQNSIGLSKPTDLDSVNERRWHEVLECWSPRYVTVVVDRQEVVSHRRNPFAHGRLPFAHLRNYYIPGEHYGMSDFQLVESMLLGLIDMRNVEATVALLSAAPYIKHSLDVDTRQLRHGIGEKWKVPTKESVLEFMQPPPTGQQVAMAANQSLRDGMDRSLGTSDVFRGATGPNRSATATSLAYESGGIRSQLAVDTVEHGLLRPVANDWQSMVRQLGPARLVVRQVGDPQGDPVQVDLDGFRDMAFMSVPTSSAAQFRVLEEKRAEDLYNNVMVAQDANVDRRALLELYLDNLFPRYKQRLLKPLAQVAAEMAAAAQGVPPAVVAAAGVAAGGTPGASQFMPGTQQQFGAQGVAGSAAVQGRALTEPGNAVQPEQAFAESLANDLGEDQKEY